MKIMVCFDGSEVAKKALEVAKDRAVVAKGKVDVVLSSRTDEEEDSPLLASLHQAHQYLVESGVESEAHFLNRGLDPAIDLLQFSKSTGADEIVVGVHHKSKVGKAVFGSVAQYLILHAECPVVSVK